MDSPVQSTAPRWRLNVTTTTGGPAITLSRSTVGGQFAPVVSGGSARTRRPFVKHSTPNIESAVYAYVRAMRTLGHTHVRSENVSRALQISLSAAMAALQALEDKGVRRSK
jgi:hypothetical protein